MKISLFRCSYILKINIANYCFICNRNSEDYSSIFRDKYVKWWESNKLCDLDLSDEGTNIQILEVINLDNFKLRHQKELNIIKKQYIDEFNAVEEDKELSNKLFNDYKQNYRKLYKAMYRDFIYTLRNIDNIHNKIYEYGKKLFYKKDNDWFFNMTRENIWKENRFSEEQKVILILLRDYIKERRNNNEQYPFTKGMVKWRIKNIIKIYDKIEL